MSRPQRDRTPIYRDWTLLQLAALALALDQLTKFVVRQTLEWHHTWPVYGFFRFTHVQNTGSAFGLFQGNNLPLLIVSLVGVAVLAYIYRSQERPGILMRVSIALMLGGALGNLMDRIWQGHVTDFIDIGPWPVFNLADSSIVVGLLILAWVLVVRREPPASPAPHTAAYAACPICDGAMISLPNGARCADCGVRERFVAHQQQDSPD